MSVSFFVFLPVKNLRYKCFCYKRNPYENIVYHSFYSFSKQNALQIMMLGLSDLQGYTQRSALQYWQTFMNSNTRIRFRPSMKPVSGPFPLSVVVFDRIWNRQKDSNSARNWFNIRINTPKKRTNPSPQRKKYEKCIYLVLLRLLEDKRRLTMQLELAWKSNKQ